MKNKIINMALAFALKDIAALLRFVGTLESRLKTFIVQQDAKTDALAVKIEALAAERAKLIGDTNLAINIKVGVSNLRG